MHRCASIWGVLLFVLAAGCRAGDPPPPRAEPQPTPTSLTASSAPEVAVLPKSFLCKSGPLENGNPQSRYRAGGCVEGFQYFFAENGATPPDELPSVAYAYHFAVTRGTDRYVKVELQRAGEDTCVKASGTGQSIVDGLPLYEVFATTAEGERVNLCAGEAYAHLPQEELRCSREELRRLDGKATAIPGYWEWDSRKGEYREKVGEKSVFTMACATGVAAKCMHWGYPPWADYNGTPLKDHFLACVRAARAQYRSDKETPYTCAGAVIDISDNLGIQVEDASLPELSFEAAWGKDGLVSFRRPRYEACGTKPEIQELLSAAQGAGEALIAVRSGRNTAALDQCPDEADFCAPSVDR